jgi:peptide/nickel transport system permease protein
MMSQPANEGVLPGRFVDRAEPRWGRLPTTVLRFARREPLGTLCALVILIFCLMAIFAPLVTTAGPTALVAAPLEASSRTHPLGTDQFGRDVFSRVVYGARISLAVGVLATSIAALGAAVLGIASAYVGGWVDSLLQRLVDAVQAIPPIVFLIGLVVALNPSFKTVVIALAARGAFVLSRIVRSAALTIKDQQFIEAARSTGVSGVRLMWRHILPNVVPVLIVLFSVNVSTNIIAEASLSFLGYGIQPPAPTWGGMMSGDARLYMIARPWLLMGPVFALGLTVFAFNMFGDALRDRLDPRLRGR